MSAFLEWVTVHRSALESAIRVHGALLFRGTPVRTDQAFDAAVCAFGRENFAYTSSLSNAVRRERSARVFTANEAPPEVEIFLHHELAQTPSAPPAISTSSVNSRQRQVGRPPCCVRIGCGRRCAPRRRISRRDFARRA